MVVANDTCPVYNDTRATCRRDVLAEIKPRVEIGVDLWLRTW